MGRRSAVETTIAILAAFARQRTWSQSDLARELGVSVDTVRDHLQELSRTLLTALERQEERPHVFWSMPAAWHPGGVLVPAEQVVALLRQLARAPATQERDHVCDALLASMAGTPDYRGVVAGPHVMPEYQAWLSALEEHARRGVAIRMQYFSAARSALEERRVSVQRVLPAQRRFVAWCHRAQRLKWFRLEGVTRADPDPAEPFHVASAADVTRFVDESSGGFHGGGAPQLCCFTIRSADAAWVLRQLPDDVLRTPTAGGLRVEMTTSGTEVLARFLAGLGDAVLVETPALRDMVVALAQQTLRAHAAPD